MCENDKKECKKTKVETTNKHRKYFTLFHLVFDCRWFSRKNEVTHARILLAQISGAQFELKDICAVKNHLTRHTVLWLYWGGTNYFAILNFLMLQIKDALVYPVTLCWGVLTGCIEKCSEKL